MISQRFPGRVRARRLVGAIILVAIAALAVIPAQAALATAPTPSDTSPLPTNVSTASTAPQGNVVQQGHSTHVTETVPSSGTPPYAWQWLYSTNGGASYAAATNSECAVPSGSGATAGSVETCTFQTSSSTPTGSYLFELKVSDSASMPESSVSAASTPVTVTPATSASTTPAGPPALDTEPSASCTGGCPTSSWFGSALTITTVSANELLVLEITDSGESGSGLATTDLSDSSVSTWHAEPENSWNGTGSDQYFFYAVDPVSGADTVTIDSAAGSLTSATTATAILAAFSGVNISAPIAAVGSFSTGTGTQSNGIVSTFLAPTTILGVVSSGDLASAFSPTASPVFSTVGTVDDGVATASFLESYGTLSTGTYTSTPTWTNSAAWGEQAIAIEGASPLSASISPTSPELDLGQSVTLTAIAAGGTGALSYAWSVASGSCPGFLNSGAPTLLYNPSGTTGNCVITVTVTDANLDSAQPETPASIEVASALSPPTAPTPGASALDENQVLSITGTIPSSGTSPYSWQWLVSLNGGADSVVTHCIVSSGSGASGGAVETCSIPANTLILGGSYTYELRVTDAATVAETATSPASASVVVSSTLTVPAAPAVSAPKLDVNQAESLTAAIPATGTAPYSWQWLVSVNSGAYVAASQCVTNSGSGGSGGAGETCSIAASSLVSGDTYSFKFQVTDSATSPEVTVSGAAQSITVKSQLTAPSTPNPSVTSLPASSVLTVTAVVPSTGTANYAWQWLISIDGAAYVAATYCAVNSGGSAGTGATETCSVAANTLAAGTTYNFELKVTDSATTAETTTSAPSATVTTTNALAGGTPSPGSAVIDNGQSIMLTANPSGGTLPYTNYQWYSGTSAANCVTLATPITAATGATYLASPTSTTWYCYTVEDSSPTTVTSAAAQVSVNSALTAPGVPAVSVTVLDVNQALSVTATLPSTGTTPYQWEWLVSTGGAYVKATVCGTPSGGGASLGAIETCSVAANVLSAGKNYTFEVLVNDSSSVPASLTSPASTSVAVSSTLTAPAAPTVSATKLDVDQLLTVTATIPLTGSSAYSWVWQVSINGGSYVAATQCSLNSGSGASAGAMETCTAAGSTLTVGDSYAFRIQVTDGATSPETTTSSGSSTLTVKATLVAPGAPALSAALLDLNQILKVTDIIPTTGTSNYQWEWLYSTGSGYFKAVMCTAPSGSNAAANSTEICTVNANVLVVGDSYTFELKVNDSATVFETQTSVPSTSVAVSATLTAPVAPTVSATKLDLNQALTVTGAIPLTGTPTYSWLWLVSVEGSVYSPAPQCAVGSGSGALAGSGETCSVAAGALTPGQTYAFELQVTDAATVPETVTSTPSSTLTVYSTLLAPNTPSVSATAIDFNQGLTVTGTIPSSGTSPYAWQWLISVDGGAFANAAQCAINSGIGGVAGSLKTCSIGASGPLSAGHTYAFELEVTDSATSPETQPSPSSAPVSVATVLGPPAAPTVSATALDVNQPLTVTDNVPTSGTAPYSFEWLFSIGSGYSRAIMCATPSGSGALAGALETCSIAGGALTVGYSYTFELLVNDSATPTETQTSTASSPVVVSSALTAASAPSVSATKLDADQPLTVTAKIPNTGTGPYSYEWLYTSTFTYTKASVCALPSGSGTSGGTVVTCAVAGGSLISGDSYSFELLVNDSATSFESATSSASSSVGVSPALTAPTAPSLGGVSKLDADQALTVTDNIPSTGTGSYEYEWLVSVGAGYTRATVCAVPSGSGASVGAPETCSIGPSTLAAGATYTFEFKVNDSATLPESATSSPSPALAVASALTAPAAPTVSGTKLDVDQTLTVSAAIPSTGTSTYAWEWLVSTGGGYARATKCATPSGSGALSGTIETCSIASGALTAGTAYMFELNVNDSATATETATSLPSPSVAVSAALNVPAAPLPSASKLDVNQVLTVTGTIPSTGTPTYQYEWWFSTGAAFAKATMCATPGGSGALGGTVENCIIASSALTAGDTYSFKLSVNDSASAPETQISGASTGVLVASALGAPSAPTVSAGKLDVNQALTVSGTIPSTGTANYQYEWLVSSGSGYGKATICATPAGNGVVGGAGETCSVAAGTLTAGVTYTFELLVNDSASISESATSPASSGVVVAAALLAPSAPSVGGVSKLDQNQVLVVTDSVPTTGSPTLAYEWLVSTGTGFARASVCANPSGNGALLGASETCTIAANTLVAGDVYTFELLVNDSATVSESQTSPVSASVTVATSLVAPIAPTVSATKLDVDQVLTVGGTLPSSGTLPFQYEWLESTGGTFSKATNCGVPSGSSAAYAAVETCTIPGGTLVVSLTYTFELKVNDSATAAETAISVSSLGVAISATLTAPGPPTPGATALDTNQPVSISGTIPTTGAAPYSWQWLIAVDGGGYADAGQCGSSSSGTGASAGSVESCSVPSATLTPGKSYTFELEVTDGASSGESETSAPSVPVLVSSTLLAPSSPTVSAAKLDLDQALSVMGSIPTTGTAPYEFEWLVSTGGGYAKATICSTPSGSGASAGSPETCSVAGGSLAAGTTYTFELVVNDSATSVESATSSASLGVAVSSMLGAPSTPTVSAAKLDVNQSLTVSSTIPSTGTSPYSWQWLVSTGGGYSDAGQCGSSASGSGAGGGSPETCSVAPGTLAPSTAYTFELRVTDSASSPETSTSAVSPSVVVSTSLSAPSAPTPSASALDVDQALTVTDKIPSSGTAPYQYEWLVSTGVGYSRATLCATPSGNGASAGATETCAVSAGSLTVGLTYTFELTVNDSASTAESAVSSPSGGVSVSLALTVPATPHVSATALDADQVLTVTDTIPSSGTSPYSWQWLVSTGGSFSGAGQCAATESGSGALSGDLETCTVEANTLTSGTTYRFELQVTDSSTTHEVLPSLPSASVAVSAALAPPSAPAPSTTALDANQPLTVTDNIPLTGTATYSWSWLVAVNGGAYGAASICAVPSGSAATGGALETCAVPANTLSAGDTYNFELEVTDSASSPETATSAASPTVSASTTLTAGSPSPAAVTLDNGQSVDLTANPSGGSTPYTFQWYSGANVGACTSLADPVSGATSAVFDASPSSTTYYCYVVTDSSMISVTSSTSEIVVNSALSAPLAPTVSVTVLDVDQTLTVTASIPATGTSPYQFEWLLSSGTGYSLATVCGVASGSGATGGATENCVIPGGGLVAGDSYTFELLVNDSATTPENATSGPSPTVTVNTALTAPLAPTVSAQSLDVDQPLSVAGTLPTTGTAPYTWVWWVSIDGGGYSATSLCLAPSGTGGLGGALETCAIDGGSLTATDSYAFELSVSDSAPITESQTSPASPTVSVSSALTPPTRPSVSATALDVDQTLDVTATIPSTGTGPFAWQWLVSENGGSFSVAADCSTSSGTGAAAGSPESCVIPANRLDADSSYAFEVRVTDSATIVESETSSSSSPVSVSSSLSAPALPTVSATKLDSDQVLTVTATVPVSGTSPYDWRWLVSKDGGAYADTTFCSTNAGTSADAGAQETCTVAAGSLSASHTYNFVFAVEDSASTREANVSAASASVIVGSPVTAPDAPTLSATQLDANQGLTVSASLPTSGSATYSWVWLVSISGSAYAAATECTSNSGSGGTGGSVVTCSVSAGTLVAGDDYSFELQTTDGASSPETATSSASGSVVVNPALLAPAAPTLGAAALDLDQSLTVTAAIPGTGTATYGWRWLVSVGGAGFQATTQCLDNSGTGATAGTVVTCRVAPGTFNTNTSYTFELQVTDSSTAGAETATSAPSGAVFVSSQLTAPAAPVPSSVALTLSQSLTVVAKIPGTGSATYSWQWLVSTNGGSYSDATPCGVSEKGTGASAGATETCTIPSGSLAAGNDYSFELTVTDNATSSESATSAASRSVAVAAPTITESVSQDPVGGSYAVSGAGFSASSGVTVLFNGVRLAPSACSLGAFSGTLVTTDSSGAFACTFRVPSESAGPYSLVGEDIATSSETAGATFTVTSPSITITPTAASAGQTVTISGTGFSVGSTIASVTLGGLTVTTCTSGSLTTDGSGAFRCSFVVPSGTTGTMVTVTDIGGQSASTTFTTLAPASSSSSFPWLWIVIVVVIVAAALIAVVAQRRRRSAGARTPSEDEGPTGPAPAPSEGPISEGARTASPSPSVTPAAVPPVAPHVSASARVRAALEPLPPSTSAAGASEPPTVDPIAAALAALPPPEYLQDEEGREDRLAKRLVSMAEEAESSDADMDSILAELDRLSEKIRTRSLRKESDTTPQEEDRGQG